MGGLSEVKKKKKEKKGQEKGNFTDWDRASMSGCKGQLISELMLAAVEIT